MGFGEAVKSVYGQYANFKGRARRSEYWYFALFMFLAIVAFVIVDLVVFGYPALVFLFLLVTFLPQLAVCVRRLHDSGKSGWFYFVNFIPGVGPFILIYFMILDSQPAANEYGPSPKGAGSSAGYGYQP